VTPRLSSLLAVVPNRPLSTEPDGDYLIEGERRQDLQAAPGLSS